MRGCLFWVFAIFSAPSFSVDFVDPLGFDGSESQKQAVVDYIKENVKRDYAAIGMDDPVTLRMMEQENLDAFKQLTKITLDKEFWRRVKNTYCAIGMCNYKTLHMMYLAQERNAKQELTW